MHPSTAVLLPTRANSLPTTSSTLFANNIHKYLVSFGPQTGGEKGHFAVDFDDEVVRGSLVTMDGEVMWPPPAPEPSPAAVAAAPSEPAAPAKSIAELRAELELSPRDKTMRSAMTVAGAGAALYALGAAAPEPSMVTQLSTLTLSTIVGYQVRVEGDLWSVMSFLSSGLDSHQPSLSLSLRSSWASPTRSTPHSWPLPTLCLG